MRLDRVNPIALQTYKKLIDDPDVVEPTMHKFMEENTEFIPTFLHYLHHGICVNSVFSQYPVGALKCDFVFLTKHTDIRRAVFIELEKPSKSLFLKDRNYVRASQDLNGALDQVRAWKRDLDANLSLLDDLNRLWGDKTHKTRDVKFTVVIGRDDELAAYPERRAYLGKLLEEGIHVATYDTIYRYIKFNIEPIYKNCVLAIHIKGFRIKSLDGVPHDLLQSFPPDCLELTAEQAALLERAGYDIKNWRRGGVYGNQPALRIRPVILPEETRLAELIRETWSVS